MNPRGARTGRSPAGNKSLPIRYEWIEQLNVLTKQTYRISTMKTKLISAILLTVMLAACSTQPETTSTATRQTAVTTATASSQASGPPPTSSLPSTPTIGGAY